MDSLQHIVATDDDDDEVQLVNLAVQQRRGRRQDSPSYAEPALERRTDVRPGEVSDATIRRLSVPAV